MLLKRAGVVCDHDVGLYVWCKIIVMANSGVTVTY